MQGLTQFLLPIVVLLVFAYLLLIRPARQRARAMSQLQSELSAGDQVMLGSGIFGTVTWLGDDRVGVEVAPGVGISVHRAAISKIVHDEAATFDADTPGSRASSAETPPPAADPVDDGDSDHNRGAI